MLYNRFAINRKCSIDQIFFMTFQFQGSKIRFCYHFEPLYSFSISSSPILALLVIFFTFSGSFGERWTSHCDTKSRITNVFSRRRFANLNSSCLHQSQPKSSRGFQKFGHSTEFITARRGSANQPSGRFGQ